MSKLGWATAIALVLGIALGFMFSSQDNVTAAPNVVNTFNTRSGNVTLTASDVSAALAFTPANETDLTATNTNLIDNYFTKSASDSRFALLGSSYTKTESDAKYAASGQVVTSLNNLTGGVTLSAGSNITITPSGNNLTIASSSSSQPLINPLRVATLQWYERNRTGAGISFGQEVFGLVFDGSSMWATTVDSSLIKFNPSDGAILGTFSVGIDDSGGAMTYDGTNIWVGTNNRLLLKFRASDGALLGTFSYFTVTSQPVAFDGEHIWVGDGFRLFKLRPSDGAIVDQVTLVSPVLSLAVDNQFWMWAGLLNGTVVRVHVSDSEIIGPYTVGTNPMSMAFDGANMWVANFNSHSVTKLRGSDGAVLQTFILNQVNPRNIVFDGVNMWVANFASNSVTRIRVSDGVMNSLNVGIGMRPRRIAFDGANIWVSHQTGITKL